MTHSVANPWFFAAFLAVVLILLTIDLGIFQRQAHKVSVTEALVWSVVWVLLSVFFGSWVYAHFGSRPGLEFFTGYLIEYALSVDNIFIFVLIFSYFAVPSTQHHRVLFWGILGALIMRGIFILVGVGLIRRFHFLIYVFGAFLVYAGIKLFREPDKEIHPENNPVLRLFRRWMPVTPDYVGGKFFVRQPGLYATPLLIVLLVVETTDVLFATDSVPAILAITLNAFIVYTSNVFAILGLRSMYFALAGLMDRFRYLHYGLALILCFVGVKMLISGYYSISTEIALIAVGATLAVAVLASLFVPQKTERKP